MTTKLDTDRNEFDIPNMIIYINGMKHRAKIIDGEVHRETHVRPDKFVRAPKWAQSYYDQVKQELSDEGCRKCGGSIRMIAYSGTGFCSGNCQTAWDDADLRARMSA